MGAVIQLRPVPIRNDDLRTAAWTLFIAEYAAGIDADPGEARRRYIEQIARIELLEAKEAGNV